MSAAMQASDSHTSASLDASVASSASESLGSALSNSAVRSDAMALSHPENLRELSEPADKPALTVSDSSASEDADSAEGDLDDEAYDEEGEDALISTASFQNGDEVIVSSASSPYNGERARIVDIRGEKLMVSVKDEQLVLTLDEVKSLNEVYDSKAANNKNVRSSTRIRHQPQVVSPFHAQEKARRNDRPKRDAAGNGFAASKSSAAPRSRNNSKAMLGKRVAIVGGRNKGERGRVTKGANGYFTIVLERSATNPSSNTQVMKRSHDLKVIDGSGDFPIPHRRSSGWNKKNKSRPYDETEDEMDDDKDDDDLSEAEESSSSSSKRWSGYSRSRSRSVSPSLSASHSEMESEPLSDSESSLLMQSDDENERTSLASSPHSHSHSRGTAGVKSKSVANIEREAAQILMDILQARANSQLLKRHYGEKVQSEPQLKRSRTFTYEEGNRGTDGGNESNHAMATEEYGAALRQEVHHNLNVVIGQEDHQFYTPLLSSTSTVPSHHASPAIAPVDESKLYPASPYTTLSTPLQLTSAQNSPSMKAMSAAANAMHYQKAMTTPTHGARPQFFPATPRSPSSKAVLLPATPNGGLVPQYPRVSAPTLYQIPAQMPQAIRASPNQIPFAVNRQQMTILSTAASTVM